MTDTCKQYFTEMPESKEEKLIHALHAIAALGGNLPDDRFQTRSGANDAAYRGLLFTEARRIAKDALKENGYNAKAL